MLIPLDLESVRTVAPLHPRGMTRLRLTRSMQSCEDARGDYRPSLAEIIGLPTKHGSGGNVAFGFLEDANGNSPARTEFLSFLGSHQKLTERVAGHWAMVDLSASMQSYALSQAQREAGVRPEPDLYWWDFNGLGAFYAYDGTNLTVVLMDLVGNPPTYGDLLARARQRL
jgi:hypothetical protein